MICQKKKNELIRKRIKPTVRDKIISKNPNISPDPGLPSRPLSPPLSPAALRRHPPPFLSRSPLLDHIPPQPLLPSRWHSWCLLQLGKLWRCISTFWLLNVWNFVTGRFFFSRCSEWCIFFKKKILWFGGNAIFLNVLVDHGIFVCLMMIAFVSVYKVGYFVVLLLAWFADRYWN